MNKKILMVAGIIGLSILFMLYAKHFFLNGGSDVKHVERLNSDMEFLKERVEKRDSAAMFILGNRYLKGDDIKKDDSKGICLLLNTVNEGKGYEKISQEVLNDTCLGIISSDH